MRITLYGIPNCDTVKKARTWLEQHGLAYTFHDFKKAGLDAATVDHWLTQLDWEVLINRKGTTWRGLDDAAKAAVIDAASARAAMIAQPSLVKRPVLVTPTLMRVGFSAESYAQDLGTATGLESKL